MTKEKEKELNLRFEKWDGVSGYMGTIRTIPENYYVCDVDEDNHLHFRGLEAITKSCNQQKILEWWQKQS